METRRPATAKYAQFLLSEERGTGVSVDMGLGGTGERPVSSKGQSSKLLDGGPVATKVVGS